VEDQARSVGGCAVWRCKLKIINAKTMVQIDADQLSQMLANEYADLWLAKFGTPPRGMHPIPSNVAEDEVQFFISFSEHQE